ncbi:MAG: hypothetical protein EZS28_009263 [Streblomastix strix]|uniref:Uncharacterized protein n=1 Tax=Streblomastix strix TaxID=222440 RepID=A0A5J4WJF9_9EUKA|nr:MAG: hypothetical protein EZS28_009263 [Streblomastix strix]
MSQNPVVEEIQQPDFQVRKYRRPRYIEPATRFLQIKQWRRKGRENEDYFPSQQITGDDYIIFADRLYQLYINRKFTQDASLMTSYALFLRSFRYKDIQNINPQLSLIANILDRKNIQKNQSNDVSGQKNHQSQTQNILNPKDNEYERRKKYEIKHKNEQLEELKQNCIKACTILQQAQHCFPFSIDKWIIYSQMREIQEYLYSKGLLSKGDTDIQGDIDNLIKGADQDEDDEDEDEQQDINGLLGQKGIISNDQFTSSKSFLAFSGTENILDKKNQQNQSKLPMRTSTTHLLELAETEYLTSLYQMQRMLQHMSRITKEPRSVMKSARQSILHGEKCRHILLTQVLSAKVRGRRLRQRRKQEQVE